MSRARVLRVAVNVPLARLFDYLPPDGAGTLVPGMRLRVPFGRRRQVAMLMDVAEGSELPAERLRRAGAPIDEDAVLGPDDLWLIRFASDYYHHPIGEVVAAALPAALRQGGPVAARVTALALTAAGRDADAARLARRAPRQAELLDALRAHSPLTEHALDGAVPGWRRSRKGLADKGFIETLEVADTPPPLAAAPAVPGPPPNAEQRQALEDLRAHSGFGVSLLDGVTGSGKTEV
ncbi:MAG TPA: primosomal protein N', partial [Woeseiaceae bacterium]|nr:primosomal protein N' [Woeseiaceae bacterium]